MDLFTVLLCVHMHDILDVNYDCISVWPEKEKNIV